MKDNLQTLLNRFALDTSSAVNNFDMANWYFENGQYASAISYYIRAAERTDITLLSYECLIKASMCFDEQGSRGFSVKGMIQRAIALLPIRPEGYYMLSRLHEKQEEWNEGYMISSIGHSLLERDRKPLSSWIDIPVTMGYYFKKVFVLGILD